MTLSKKMIDEIRKHTPFLMVGRKANDFKYIDKLGYYQKRNTNWSYAVEWRLFNDIPVLVVVKFGDIVGVSEGTELTATEKLTKLLELGGTVKFAEELIKLGSNCKLVRNFKFVSGTVDDALMVDKDNIKTYYGVSDLEFSW